MTAFGVVVKLSGRLTDSESEPESACAGAIVGKGGEPKRGACSRLARKSRNKVTLRPCQSPLRLRVTHLARPSLSAFAFGARHPRRRQHPRLWPRLQKRAAVACRGTAAAADAARRREFDVVVAAAAAAGDVDVAFLGRGAVCRWGKRGGSKRRRRLLVATPRVSLLRLRAVHGRRRVRSDRRPLLGTVFFYLGALLLLFFFREDPLLFHSYQIADVAIIF